MVGFGTLPGRGKPWDERSTWGKKSVWRWFWRCCEGREKSEVLARRHEVCANTPRRYRDEFIAGGRAQVTGKSPTQALGSESKALKHQIEEHDMVIGEYTIANRVLKKRSRPDGRLTWEDEANLTDEIQFFPGRIRTRKVLGLWR